MPLTDLIVTAQAFAHQAHDSIGQTRKFSDEPHWKHTDEVASITWSATRDPVLVAVAHLHDVLEDVAPRNPEYSAERIGERFGDAVLKGVVDLTDVYVRAAYPDLNRAARKVKERERLAGIPGAHQSVKLADIISNASDLAASDAKFARMYLSESAELLPLLKEGSADLWARANDAVRMALSELGPGP